MVTIIGAKGNQIQDVKTFFHQVSILSTKYDILIQAIDADYVYGKSHLISAVEHAKRAFEHKTNSLNALELEILLYASGERQIQKAIEKIGVKKGTEKIAFIFIPKNKRKNLDDEGNQILLDLDFKRDDKVLEGDINTLYRFGITKEEIYTIDERMYGDLLLEKVALVDIIK